MTTFTKVEIKNFRSDFEKAVRELEKQYNVKMSLGNISFSPDRFTTKMTVERSVSKSKKEDTERNKWNLLCSSVGLEPEDFGFTYNSNGKTVKVIGINLRAPKNSINLVDEEGKLWKTTPTSIKFAKMTKGL